MAAIGAQVIGVAPFDSFSGEDLKSLVKNRHGGLPLWLRPDGKPRQHNQNSKPNTEQAQ